MTKKNEKEIIKEFVNHAVKLAKHSVSREGVIHASINVLIQDENGEYQVDSHHLPDMPTGDDFASFIKAIAMKAVIEAYLVSLVKRKNKLLYLVHTELITFDNGDQTLLVLQKDNKGNIINNFYDVVRKESTTIDENGDLVLSEAEFVERDIKTGA